MSDLAADFATLFEGNRLAVGEELGGCTRLTNNGAWTIRLQQHLSGANGAVGVYPMVWHGLHHGRVGDNLPMGWGVKWGAVDFDVRSDKKPSGDFDGEHEAHEAAVNLQKTLRVGFGITSWIEVTRSRGRHVWVFAEEWTPAATMRRALLVACRLAEVPTREVNPKQEELADGQLGNYVRLPYPGDVPRMWSARERTVLFQHDEIQWCSMACDVFVARALAERTRTGLLRRASLLWTPPPSSKKVRIARDLPPAHRTSAIGRLNGLAYTILQDGPLDGSDRSTTLYRLARECRNSGLTASEAFAVVAEGDERWGKFSGRHDADAQIQKLIERAYSA